MIFKCRALNSQLYQAAPQMLQPYFQSCCKNWRIKIEITTDIKDKEWKAVHAFELRHAFIESLALSQMHGVRGVLFQLFLPHVWAKVALINTCIRNLIHWRKQSHLRTLGCWLAFVRDFVSFAESCCLSCHDLQQFEGRGGKTTRLFLWFNLSARPYWRPFVTSHLSKKAH